MNFIAEITYSRKSTIPSVYKMSNNLEVEPGAAPESILVTTESFDNLEQMSSSLEEIKITNAINQNEESNDNDNENTDEQFEESNSLQDDEEDDLEINKKWTDKRKHVFVLSLAGKPIYSR